MQKEIKDFSKKHEFDKYYMIGVHYRSWKTGAPDKHSGLIDDPNDRYVPEFIKEMTDILNKPLNETNNKPVAFFLSSDHTDAKKKIMAEKLFKGRIFTRVAQIERETIQGQQSAMVDFYLLGQTELIIGTFQSSFSDEASWLTKQRRKIPIGKNPYIQK